MLVVNYLLDMNHQVSDEILMRLFKGCLFYITESPFCQKNPRSSKALNDHYFIMHLSIHILNILRHFGVN